MTKPRIDLDKVKEIYYTQTKIVPTCLTEVCEELELNYMDLIEHLRQLSYKAKELVLIPHILPPRFSYVKHVGIGEILFDYRMITSYSYDLIAIIFGYDNKSNVHRACRRAKHFGLAEPKRLFPEALTLEWHPNELTKSSSLVQSTFSLNKALYDLAIDPMHIPAVGIKPTNAIRRIEVYKPVYEMVVAACLRSGENMNDFINNAILRACT